MMSCFCFPVSSPKGLLVGIRLRSQNSISRRVRRAVVYFVEVLSRLLDTEAVKRGVLESLSFLAPGYCRGGKGKCKDYRRAFTQGSELMENPLSGIALHYSLTASTIEHGNLGEEKL